MDKPVNDMTLDECRHAIAIFAGWHRTEDRHAWSDGIERTTVVWTRGVETIHGTDTEPPIPPTLDAIAGAMPEGWLFCVDNLGHPNGAWRAHGWHHDDERGPHDSIFFEADTEIHARARLAVSCCRAQKGANPNV